MIHRIADAHREETYLSKAFIRINRSQFRSLTSLLLDFEYRLKEGEDAKKAEEEEVGHLKP
jgi:hypothetical protein